MSTIEKRIDNYWALRAEELSRSRILELAGPDRMFWHNFFKNELPECSGRKVRALDCGCGAGFFAFILSELGCETTGIDYSQSMIDHAEENASHLRYPPITFKQMDAQNMTFEDGAFDFIVSRFMTWTVPEPEKVYSEWARLLTPVGIVINFDANYGNMFRMQDDTGVTDKMIEEWEKSDNKTIGIRPDLIRERDDITRELSITEKIRPQWDVDMLLRLGFDQISIDMNVVYEINKEYRESVPECPKDSKGMDYRIFCVKGIKAGDK